MSVASRLVTLVGSVVLAGACTQGRGSGADAATSDAASGGDASGADGGGEAGSGGCQPVAELRGLCREPLDTSLCVATWEARPEPECGLLVYEGEGAGYLLQYVSYVDIPPLGGPSWMCIYDVTSHALVGTWALDHYMRWCCNSSLDRFQGVGSDAIAGVAMSMATTAPCPAM